MAGEDASASVEFRQHQVSDAIADAEKEYRRVNSRALVRRCAEYGLKGTAVFGGVAIAAGLPATAAHALGVAIAVATVTDVVLTRNHARLLSDVRAERAYARLLADVKHQYNMELGPILRLRKQPDLCLPQLDALCERTLTLLHGERRRIDDALTAQDLTELERLSMEKQAGEPKAGG